MVLLLFALCIERLDGVITTTISNDLRMIIKPAPSTINAELQWRVQYNSSLAFSDNSGNIDYTGNTKFRYNNGVFRIDSITERSESNYIGVRNKDETLWFRPRVLGASNQYFPMLSKYALEQCPISSEMTLKGIFEALFPFESNIGPLRNVEALKLVTPGNGIASIYRSPITGSVEQYWDEVVLDDKLNKIRSHTKYSGNTILHSTVIKYGAGSLPSSFQYHIYKQGSIMLNLSAEVTTLQIDGYIDNKHFELALPRGTYVINCKEVPNKESVYVSDSVTVEMRGYPNRYEAIQKVLASQSSTIKTTLVIAVVAVIILFVVFQRYLLRTFRYLLKHTPYHFRRMS